MSDPTRDQTTNPQESTEGRLDLRLDRFALEALRDEAEHLGVSVQELARFAILYYIADEDSGRIARRIPPSGEDRPTAIVPELFTSPRRAPRNRPPRKDS